MSCLIESNLFEEYDIPSRPHKESSSINTYFNKDNGLKLVDYKLLANYLHKNFVAGKYSINLSF